jgi:hypothetical protein
VSWAIRALKEGKKKKNGERGEGREGGGKAREKRSM